MKVGNMRVRLFLLGSLFLSQLGLAQPNFFGIGNTLAAPTVAPIYVFDAQVTLLMPTKDFKGIMVYANGQPTKEATIAQMVFQKNLITPEVLYAQENLTKTQTFYSNIFGRYSYDNQGSNVDVAVNVNKDMPFDIGLRENAMWMENLKLFVFGDGVPGGELQNFISSLEVVAHEFTHAVISSTSKLEYEGQSGALNEHFADVFGVMARQYFTPDYSHPFLVGDNALTAKGKEKAEALRDMINPNKGLMWQPQSMSEIPEKLGASCVPSGTNDHCGVHTLSGIPNRAAALIIQKLGWEKSRKLLYAVMTVRMQPKSQFADYRKETLLECNATLDQADCEAVTAAFDTVGVK